MIVTDADLNQYVAERLAEYALPRTAQEAECFLWDALYHLTEGQILCRVPRRGLDAGRIIREAIARINASYRREITQFKKQNG